MLSPESMSRKRTRLEDQLSDIQYIDCNTPETISTTAVIHTLPEPQKTSDSYQPKNKSPRNSSSENENKRQSLNLEAVKTVVTSLPKSLTDTKLLVLNTPQSPIYQPLTDSSTTTTTPDFSTTSERKSVYENIVVAPKSPTYENVLTTISITYKSPPRTATIDSIYEDVSVNPEKAVVPTADASLPIQEATQPEDAEEIDLTQYSSTENLSKKTSLETLSDLEIANCDKRKSCESETCDDDGSVYQQVKYFRRSIHEINALLELDNDTAAIETTQEAVSDKTTDEPPDSLEAAPCVKDLKSVFEEKSSKIYDRESLPPCLRARNLKNQTKTRSLDENEFKQECGASLQQQRRKSMDETLTNKTSNAPKILNQPKEVPQDDNGKLATLHLSHMIPCEQLRRDRIEKYKEARRKFLQDKYRSESFKEDKDVLLSRLKVFRKNCDESSEVQTRLEDLSLRVRRTRRNKDEETASDVTNTDSLEEENNSLVSNKFRESFKTRAALFERKEEDVDGFLRRRHTYDSRERETETERVRRISLENKSPR